MEGGLLADNEKLAKRLVMERVYMRLKMECYNIIVGDNYDHSAYPMHMGNQLSDDLHGGMLHLLKNAHIVAPSVSNMKWPQKYYLAPVGDQYRPGITFASNQPVWYSSIAEMLMVHS